MTKRKCSRGRGWPVGEIGAGVACRKQLQLRCLFFLFFYVVALLITWKSSRKLKIINKAAHRTLSDSLPFYSLLQFAIYCFCLPYSPTPLPLSFSVNFGAYYNLTVIAFQCATIFRVKLLMEFTGLATRFDSEGDGESASKIDTDFVQGLGKKHPLLGCRVVK